MKFFFHIKNRLFFVYTLYSCTITVLLALGFYFYAGNILEANSREVLVQTCDKVHAKLETTLSDMDTICLQAISNADLREILRKSNESYTSYNYFDYHDNAVLSNILVSINSPLLNNYRISIFDTNRNFLTIGSLDINSEKSYQILNPYLQILSETGSQFLVYPPHSDNWVSYSPETVFSFVRIIPNIQSVNEVLGYIEVQQPYSMISDICNWETPPDISVTIFDRNHQLIFPYDTLSEDAERVYLDILSREEEFGKHSGSPNLYFYQQSLEHYGWTVLLTQKENDFCTSEKMLQKVLILFTISFTVCSAWIISWFTKRLTQPINNLRKSVETVSELNSTIDLTDEVYDNEILMLKDAFNQAFTKLNAAMQQAIIADHDQMQAHLFAMQAQMNPHFLFNTLMAISGIADEQGDTKIVLICNKLSSMLRYVSSFRDATVHLKEEMAYVENYLELMKVRYEEFLVYEFDVDASLLDYAVPKLIIQPIVENCFSHGFRDILPPYHVAIELKQCGNHLEICVTDNGEGFTDEYLREFREKIAAYEKDFDIHHYVQTGKLGGLGLINIYLRLRLKYRSEIQMKIGNNSAQGAYVQLIIPIEEE